MGRPRGGGGLDVNLLCTFLISGCLKAISSFQSIRAKLSSNTVKDFNLNLIQLLTLFIRACQNPLSKYRIISMGGGSGCAGCAAAHTVFGLRPSKKDLLLGKKFVKCAIFA